MSDFNKLRDAVKNLYFAAHWSPDRQCDEEALWTAVRDAAGFEPGASTKVLGEVRKPNVEANCACNGNCGCSIIEDDNNAGC